MALTVTIWLRFNFSRISLQLRSLRNFAFFVSVISCYGCLPCCSNRSIVQVQFFSFSEIRREPAYNTIGEAQSKSSSLLHESGCIWANPYMGLDQTFDP